jgi:hypothetical protein
MSHPSTPATTDTDRARRVADLVEAMGWDADRVSPNHPVFFEELEAVRESDAPSDPLVD